MFKVNEIIHLYVNLSVLKIQIENKHVAAMFYPFPVWSLLDSANLKLSAKKKKKKKIIRAN